MSTSCGWEGKGRCMGVEVKLWNPLRTRAIYLSACAVVIHYEEALYQVYAPLPFYFYSKAHANHASSSRHIKGQLGTVACYYFVDMSDVSVVSLHQTKPSTHNLASSGSVIASRDNPEHNSPNNVSKSPCQNRQEMCSFVTFLWIIPVYNVDRTQLR